MLASPLRADADDDCSQPLTQVVRDELATRYECGLDGTRCVDGHIGVAFINSNAGSNALRPDKTGYIDGNRFYEKATPGSAIVHVFASADCGEDRLAGLAFATSTVKERDSNLEGSRSAPPSKDKKESAADAKAADDVKDAKTKVDKTIADAREKVASTAATLKNDAGALCAMAKVKDGCEATLTKSVNAVFVTSVSASEATKAIDEARSNLDKLLGPEQATLVGKQLIKLKETYDDSSKAIAKTVDELRTEIRENKDLQPAVASDVKSTLSEASKAIQQNNWEEVQALLREVESEIPTPANSWPYTTAQKVKIAVKTKSHPVPEGDTNRFFTVTVSNLTTVPPGADIAARKQKWPDTTVSVKVDHGRYYWEAGYMFAAIFHGKRVVTSTASACPEACEWAFQSMITGTVFLGRAKFAAYDHRNWIPGLQAGFNADISKIADALSLGLVLEPITGLAISGGAMFYSRASGAAREDGTTPMENRFVPYVGLTLNSEFFNTVKGLASSDDKAGNAEKEK